MVKAHRYLRPVLLLTAFACGMPNPVQAQNKVDLPPELAAVPPDMIGFIHVHRPMSGTRGPSADSTICFRGRLRSSPKPFVKTRLRLRV